MVVKVEVLLSYASLIHSSFKNDAFSTDKVINSDDLLIVNGKGVNGSDRGLL
jgi:hypothetical protein